MEKLNLGGKWTLTFEDQKIQGQVPGSVYNDMMAAGILEDPFYRDNELKTTPLMEKDYTYEREVDLKEDFLKNEVLVLRCEGLDTVAEVFVNDIKVGYADNMHRCWEFDVKEVIKTGINKIHVTLKSPINYIRQAFEKSPIEGSPDAMRGFPHLRKAHCMFGWDWGPRLPDAGIWRDIALVGWNRAKLESVYIRQNHLENKVEISLEPEIIYANYESEKQGVDIEAKITSPDGEVTNFSGNKATISNPKLWWPNGYGNQPLYTVTVLIKDELGEVLDSFTRRIGLRSLTVKNEEDKWGRSFTQVVNGVEVFAMGADYIPEDNILPRVNPERTRKLLLDCVRANYNSIRVWGGGYYPDDYFFDICDELGLMVWQDCMFACALYDLTPEFDENIRVEITQNIKRLRHHASLALWCGNNEMEDQVGGGEYNANHKNKADYLKIFEYIIKNIAAKEDPDRFYWPSSPSSYGSFNRPNDPNEGDVHYWDVWHGNKPFSDYRNYYFRYASEFGFQSFPDIKTVASFCPPEEMNIFSRTMEMHQRNGMANGKILNYLSQTYLYPLSFENLLYASQLLQADAIRYGVEHWRRNRGRCMGAIYWQINDCWPVASWSSIDYFGRWKALHYFAKRFFSPLMISCEEEGEMTGRPSCVSEPKDIEKSAKLCVANETFKETKGTVFWAIRDAKAKIIKEGKEEITVPALSSKWLEKLILNDINELSNYISYEYVVDGKVISKGTTLFCAPKHFPFLNPDLSVKREGNEITVSSSAYARCVEIYDPESDFILSDNFFDLNGEEITVSIIEGDPKNLKVRSVYEIGREGK